MIPKHVLVVSRRPSVIYKFALDQMPREQVPELYRDFIGFEKRHGSVKGIEEVLLLVELTTYITQ